MHRQIFEYHPIIGYRFIPNLQTRIQHEGGGYLVRTNSLGFRSEVAFTSEKNVGHKRILLFGDSYTAADGVSNKKRYSDLLMQMMSGIEIYNFGMPGTGTDQQYLIYKEYAQNIEHDLVVIVVLVENIRRNNVQYRPYYNENNEKILFQKPYFQLSGEDLVLKNVPVKPEYIKPADLPSSQTLMVDEGGRFPAARAFINKIGVKNFVQNITKYQPLPEYRENKYEWSLMKAILTKWISVLRTPVMIIPLPLHHYVEEKSDYSDVEKRFNELKGIRHLTLFNPISRLKEYSMTDRQKFRFEHDSHPTEFGHEVYANIFKPEIEELLEFM